VCEKDVGSLADGAPGLECWSHPMKRVLLRTLTDDDLIGEFITRATTLGEAINYWLPAVKASKRLVQIEKEMKLRGRQFRIKLIPLLEAQDRIIRYYAARELLALVPERSRQIVEENSRQGDAIAGDAGMLLYTIDSGIYTPE